MKEKVLKYHTFIERHNEYSQELCPYRQGDDSGIFGLGSLKCEKKCTHCIERICDTHTVKCDFKVLDLSLTYHWYDEIESGRKAVEYRIMSDYWKKRLMACQNTCKHIAINRFDKCIHCFDFMPVNFNAVRFHRGQGGKQTMMYECVRIIIAKGHVRLGATPDAYLFNIYLGKRLQ